jgi:hypothetical protein
MKKEKLIKNETTKYNENKHFLKYSSCYENKEIRDCFIKFLESEYNISPYKFIMEVQNIIIEKNNYNNNFENNNNKNQIEKELIIKKLKKICKDYIYIENENQINISGFVLNEINQFMKVENKKDVENENNNNNFENNKKEEEEMNEEVFEKFFNCLLKIKEMMYAELYMDSVKKNN